MDDARAERVVCLADVQKDLGDKPVSLGSARNFFVGRSKKGREIERGGGGLECVPKDCLRVMAPPQALV